MINNPQEHIERAHEYKGKAAGYDIPPPQVIKHNIELAKVELMIATTMLLSGIGTQLEEMNKHLKAISLRIS